MRKIKIYSARTSGTKDIMSDAKSWGQLKQDQTVKSLMGADMKAMESINRTTLEVDSAVLPEGEFTLFLLPVKNKSGAITTEEMLTTIEELGTNFDEFLDKLKEYMQQEINEDLSSIKAEAQALMRELGH